MSTGANQASGQEVVHHHPTALRNRGPILERLEEVLVPLQADFARQLAANKPSAGFQALEFASGTGAHIEAFASSKALGPAWQWQPSEYVPEGLDLERPDELERVGKIGVRAAPADELASLNRAGCDVHANVHPAVNIDLSRPLDVWPAVVRERAGSYSLVHMSNVTHITPFAVTEGFFRSGARLVHDGGVLSVYGPFTEGGLFSTESNRDFDAQLRRRNPAWGYRDRDDLLRLAADNGFQLYQRFEMPANNLFFVFRRVLKTRI